MQVSATVTAACSLSTTDIVFGTINPSASNDTTTTATVSAQCTKGTSYSIGISAGSSGNVSSRTMNGASGGGNVLNYNIYTANDFQTIWGNTPGVDTLDQIGSGDTDIRPVYVKAPKGQYVKADTYTDSLVVSLTY